MNPAQMKFRIAVLESLLRQARKIVYWSDAEGARALAIRIDRTLAQKEPPCATQSSK